MNHRASRQIHEEAVSIPINGEHLEGDLRWPQGTGAVVLFAHGSGSGRKSPRNRYVAEVLNAAGFATLLMDLLTPDEEQEDKRTGQLRFDIGLLSKRLVRAIDWLQENSDSQHLRIGCFGASTGAAAALVAAAERAGEVQAIVSRGGRPDLAGERLTAVQAPTLLIIGGNDEPVVEMNREAMGNLNSKVEMEIVPGATHLFEEPGKLEEVSRLASQWFVRFLSVIDGSSPERETPNEPDSPNQP